MEPIELNNNQETDWSLVTNKQSINFDKLIKNDKKTIWTIVSYYVIAAVLVGVVSVFTIYAKTWDFRRGRTVQQLKSCSLSKRKKERLFCTGDIIMMSTLEASVARVVGENAVRKIANWNYLHVGMIVEPNRGSGEEYLWEIRPNEPATLTHFRQYITQYQNQCIIVVRHLTMKDGNEPSKDIRQELADKFFKVAPELRSKATYNFNFLEEFVDRYKDKDVDKKGRYMCFSMIGETLNRMGLCDFTKYGPNFMPVTGDYEDDCSILNECVDPRFYYEKEVKLEIL